VQKVAAAMRQSMENPKMVSRLLQRVNVGCNLALPSGVTDPWIDDSRRLDTSAAHANAWVRFDAYGPNGTGFGAGECIAGTCCYT
jgi:hypothetical protein